MSSSLIRRLLLALVTILLLGTLVWWGKRPKPIAVLFKEVDQGRVEASIANTRQFAADRLGYAWDGDVTNEIFMVHNYNELTNSAAAADQP